MVEVKWCYCDFDNAVPQWHTPAILLAVTGSDLECRDAASVYRA